MTLTCHSGRIWVLLYYMPFSFDGMGRTREGQKPVISTLCSSRLTYVRGLKLQIEQLHKLLETIKISKTNKNPMKTGGATHMLDVRCDEDEILRSPRSREFKSASTTR